MVSRLIVCCLFAAGCSEVFSQEIDSLGPPGSSLVFGDEFNAATLNAEMWGFGINDKNVQNTGVDCAYSEENISFRDGFLVFTQRRESPPILGKTWTSEKTFNYSSSWRWNFANELE